MYFCKRWAAKWFLSSLDEEKKKKKPQRQSISHLKQVERSIERLTPKVDLISIG